MLRHLLFNNSFNDIPNDDLVTILNNGEEGGARIRLRGDGTISLVKSQFETIRVNCKFNL